MFTLMGVLLSLTRPISLALVAALALLLILDPHLRDNARKRWVAYSACTVIVVASVGIWPLIAWLSTGEPKAYTLTQGAWLANGGELGLWGTWLVAPIYHGDFTLGFFSLSIVAVCLLPLLRPASRLWGSELRAWTVAYPLVMLISTRPSSSAFRYLLLTITPFWPLPELWNPSAQTVQKVARVLMPSLLISFFLYLQWVWLSEIYVVTREPQYHP